MSASVPYRLARARRNVLYSVLLHKLGRLVRVAVDRDSCEANAVCAGLVPEVFEVDDEDQLHIQVAEVPPHLADAVRQAVRSCPKAALRVED
jgi:ferredoxin